MPLFQGTPPLSAIASDHSLHAWSWPIPYGRDSSLLGTAGTMVISRLRRVPTCSVTNIVALITIAGSTLTAGQCFAALYTAAGALVGQSADQAAAWATSGAKTMALTGGPFTLTAGDYYVGYWYNGTTAPTILRAGPGTAALQNFGQSSGSFDCATADTGLTTTAPSSLGAQTATGVYFWSGLS